MTREEIIKGVNQILFDNYGIDNAELNHDLNYDLCMDSLDRLEFMGILEDTFELKSLNEDQIEDLKTLGDCINHVEAYVD